MAEGVLPPAIQSFVANATEWVAGIDEMIAADDRLLESIARIDAASTGGLGAAGAAAGAGAGAGAAAGGDAAAAEGATALGEAEAVAARQAQLLAEVDAQLVGASATVTDAMGVEAKAIALNRDAYAALGDTAVAADAKTVEANATAGESAAAMGGKAKMAFFALAATVGIGIDKAMKFQQAIVRLQTAAGLTGANMGKLGQQILMIGDRTGTSATEIATALYHPISAGLNLGAALRVVAYSAELAQIHMGTSLNDTTYALSSVMKAFGISARGAGHAAALLNSIVGQGDMTFQDFNSSVKNWAPTAAAMGISIQSMGSAIAYLTDRGNSAEVASTRLTMGLSMVTSGSKAANEYLSALGLTTGKLALKNQSLQAIMLKAGLTTNKVAADLKKPDGIYVALKQIQGAFHKAGLSASQADTVMAKIFGGGRSDKAMLSLMSHLDQVKVKYHKIGVGVATFGQSWAKTEQTAHFHWEQFKNDIGNLVTEFGTALLPTFDKVIAALSKVMSWLQQHPAIAKFAGAVIALGIAVGIAGTVVTTLAGALDALFSPVILVIAAIAALAAGIWYAYTHFKWFRTAVADVGKFFKAVWEDALHIAGEVIKWFVNGPLKFIKGEMAQFSKWWAKNGEEVKTVAKVAWKFISTYIITNIKIAFDMVKTTLEVLKAIWIAAWGIIKAAVKADWDIISTIVRVGITIVEDIISVVLDIITGHWSKAFKDVQQLTHDALHGVVQIIMSTVSNFGNLLYSAGQALLHGLISGIKSMIGGVGSALGSVGSAILSFLPNSPAAKQGPLSGHGDTRYSGQAIVANLATGILDAKHMPGSALAEALGGLAGGRAGLSFGLYGGPGVAGAAGGPAAGGTASLNVTVDLRNALSSPQWQQGLQKVIQQAVLDYALRNSGSGLVLPQRGG
jgi:TP901 family phage tail tape measure protein